MITRHGLLIRFVAVVVVLALPVALIAACGDGGFEEETTAAPAEVPDLGAAQLGGGAGPTPIPVTPTPTPTPSPAQLSLFDPVWEGTYTVRDNVAQAETTRKIVVEIMASQLIGEGANRRRDAGAILVEGVEGWMALAWVRVDPETGNVSFQVPVIKTRFDGIFEGDKITGTVDEKSVNKGTFEVHANRDKSPQRRPDAEIGGFGTVIDLIRPPARAS